MPYCARADLVERYGATEFAQLTDQTAAQSTVDALIAKACEEASSLVDSYVSARYTVPLAPVPTIVRSWACAIARRILWHDRAKPDGAVYLAYQDAISMLKDVAKGTTRLPDSTGTLPADSGGSLQVVTSDKIFTDELLGYMPG
jgi:phage gp36-like protein